MARSSRKTIARVAWACVAILVVVVGALAIANQQLISDEIEARNFSPSEQVSTLIDRLDLTPSGERVFLASKPTLDASQHFSEQCSDVSHGEQGHVLGCYSRGTIHLFGVTDKRLDGIVEVTAAHELLHAVYARMGADERSQMGKRLRAFYDERIKTDPGLKERMSVYDALSPSAFANELHSVLGTEVHSLPKWLEEHYAKWLGNRSAIVNDFDRYHGVFTQLQDRAKTLEKQMTALRTSVEQRREAYNAAVAQFNTDAQSFTKRNNAYEFADDPAEFDRIRDSLTARQQQLTKDRGQLESDIASYETMRTELQQLTKTSDELDQKLNSDLAPPATRPN